MGHGDKGPPEISLERLRSLPDEERACCWKLYKKLGGRRRRCVAKAAVKEFLLRSKLDQEVVESILYTATGENGETGEEVDFESFCVACRLVSQMQELGTFASIADVPGKPPYFEDAAEAAETPTGEFDFEGVALGINTGAAEPTSIPTGVLDVDVPVGGTETHHESSRGSNDSFSQRFAGSSAAMEAILSGVQPSDPRLVRLEGELVKCRREVEVYLGEKARLEDAASGLQDQLRSLRLRRHTIRKQLSSVAADSSRLFASIDFTRQQIEDLERLVAYLKEARSLSSKAEIASIGHIQQTGATAAGLHNEECLSNLRRSGRRKLELQSKHQLVLASYRQAEHDRNDARKALEDERDRLAKLQAARLRLCEERHAAIQEALKLAKGVGLSPLVLKELCAQELASPTVSKVHHP